MSQSTNLNRSPYFDDFDVTKNFYRVLFRPGYSIQARELTTLQSILQNQIENLSRSNYKQGSVVVPGQLIFDNKYNYVKISSFTNNLKITNYIGSNVVGFTSGVKAQIVDATDSNETDSPTIFVKYQGNGTDNNQAVFLEGEILTSDIPGNPTLVVGISGSVNPTTSPAIGYGSAITVQEGVYFINGCLVRNKTETIILDKYNNTPTKKVGFVITENLVTPEEDPSLLDNAQGFSNFSAPGAHRLKITVNLTSRTIDAPNTTDFVELLVIESGAIKRTTEVQTNTLFEQVLARRTYDESGDYVVKDFTLSLRESLNDGTNNGLYSAAEGGNEGKFIAALNAGKAYVRGFEIETVNTKYIELDKGRDYATSLNNNISIGEGNNFTVKNLYGFPDIKSLTGAAGSTITGTNAYQEINLYREYNDISYGDTKVNIGSGSPSSRNYYAIVIQNLNSTAQVVPGSTYTITFSNNTATGNIISYDLSQSKSFANSIITVTGNLQVQAGQTITISNSSGGSVTGTLYSVEYISTPRTGIAKTRYLKFLSGSDDGTGNYDPALTQHKLGVFGVYYFTRILCQNSPNFIVGASLTGQTSKATGIIEEVIASTKEVILSNVSGTFIPGEAVVSDVNPNTNTTPSNLIELEGTVRYLKANTFGSSYPVTASGIVLKVNGNTINTLSPSDYSIINGGLVNVNISQTTRNAIGALTSSPTITITASGATSASYEAVLNMKTVVNYDSSYVRSFFGSNSGISFSGDVASIQTPIILSANSTFSATEGSYYIIADNITAKPENQINPGDLIQVVDNAGVLRKYIVRYVSPAGSSKTARIYVRGSILSAITSKNVSTIRSALNGIGDSLLIPLPNTNVRTTNVTTTASGTNINYITQREFLGKFDSSGSVTFSLNANEQFLGYTSDNYILTTDQGKIVNLNANGNVSFSNTNTTCTISGTTLANTNIKLIAPVSKFNAVPKTKTLINNQQYIISTGYKNTVIPLLHADGYKLRGIYVSSTGAEPTVSDIDISSRYVFDGGQRDSYYDLARIVRKPGTLPPESSILVVYDYFKHIGTGDFFTVDSYTNVDYKDIPYFSSKSYGNISLRDCIDFRPKVSDFSTNNGADGLTVLPGYSTSPATGATKFQSTGASYSELPIFGTGFQTSFQYYLNRIDALYLTKDGLFTVSKGSPALNPQSPPEISDSMLLYYFNIPAYTYKTSDITVKSIDNRRYTMRDIGNLQTRIEKLEYYTVLSLSEQNTFNTQVTDKAGNPTFKNGIVVDNFEGHNVGDVNNPDYKCSIDTQTGLLRPSYAASQTKLIESAINDSQRSSAGYMKTGDLVTVPYTETSVVKNSDASRFIPVNPNSIANFTGLLTLTPNIDEWKDTVTPPEVISNENSIFDTFQSNNPNAWGSFWNEWQIAWTGTPNYNLSNSTNFNSSISSSSLNQFASSITNVLPATKSSRSRNGTQNRLTPYGTSSSSIGTKTIGIGYNPYIRSRLVKFVATGLQPNTQLYAFFDGVDVNAWVNPDTVNNPSTPFTGVGGYSQSGFGNPIVTDSNGNISGQFLVPNGLPPIKGTSITTLDAINQKTFYDYTAQEKRFTAGVKTFRLTSSNSNSSDVLNVTTFGETEYTVSGIFDTNSNTIQSTRPPYITRRSASALDSIQYSDIVKSNILQGTTFVDPLAQTFLIEGYPEGIFATGVDVYFRSKSADKPISAYLVETSGNVPTRRSLPFSQVSLNSDSIIRIKSSSSNVVTFNAGETIVGKVSGASGVLKISQTVNSTVSRYNLVLSNYNGVSFIPGEEIYIVRTPEVTPNKFYVDYDRGFVKKINVTSYGSAYTTNNTTINIVGDNGGNTPAAGTADIYNGTIYNIKLSNQGSGYYTAPSVNITGGDSTATAKAILEINDPAVKMGVATSIDATVKTTFKFSSPVYLQNERTYAIVFITQSKDYNIFTSKAGEALINSVVIGAPKPYVGSLFKSQNSSAWVEDPNEYLKFTVNRAVFDTNVTSTVTLVNDDLGSTLLPNNPIEISNTPGSSNLFGSNVQIIRVTHPNHGMKENDYVILSGVSGTGSPETIFGMPVSALNGLHRISNVGIDNYTIFITDAAFGTAQIQGSGSGGGKFVRATTNKLYQIIQPQIGVLEFPSSNTSYSIVTAKGKAVDSTTTDEYSLQPAESIINGDNYYFNSTRVIASQPNEVLRSLPTQLNGGKSIKYQINLQTTKDNVSPILDLQRTNVITVSNRVDNPTGNEGRFGALSQTLTVVNGSNYNPSSNQTIKSLVLTYTGSSGSGFTLTTSATNSRLTSNSGGSGQIAAIDPTNKVIRLIDVTGTFNPTDVITQASTTTTAGIVSSILKTGIVIGWDGNSLLKIKLTSPNTFDTTDIINDFVVSNPVTARTISNASSIQGFLYIPDNFSSGNSVASQYITKQFTLDTPATNIDARITANLFNNSDIKVLYKVRSQGSTEDFDQIPWTYFNGTGLADNDSSIIPATFQGLSPSVEDLNSYFEYKYTANSLPAFKSFAIKIVFNASNPALAPRCEDLRIIAHS